MILLLLSLYLIAPCCATDVNPQREVPLGGASEWRGGGWETAQPAVSDHQQIKDKARKWRKATAKEIASILKQLAQMARKAHDLGQESNKATRAVLENPDNSTLEKTANSAAQKHSDAYYEYLNATQNAKKMFPRVITNEKIAHITKGLQPKGPDAVEKETNLRLDGINSKASPLTLGNGLLAAGGGMATFMSVAAVYAHMYKGIPLEEISSPLTRFMVGFARARYNNIAKLFELSQEKREQSQ